MIHLAILGVQLDEMRNRDHGRHSQGLISPDDAAPPLMVIATSEEQMIASYTLKTINNRGIPQP